MMDVEKLIKRIKCPQIQSCPMDGEYPSCNACQKSIQQEVITALSTLQGENEKMRAELDAAIKQLHGYCPSCTHYTPNHNEGLCRTCKHEYYNLLNNESLDNWEWRGPQKED